MTWKRAEADLLEWPPYFICRRRADGRTRYLLGRTARRGDECLGGFDSADEAKQAASEHMQSDKRAA